MEHTRKQMPFRRIGQTIPPCALALVLAVGMLGCSRNETSPPPADDGDAGQTTQPSAYPEDTENDPKQSSPTIRQSDATMPASTQRSDASTQPAPTTQPLAQARLRIPVDVLANWPPRDQWAIPRGDQALTGRARGTLPEKPQLLWEAKLGDSILSIATIVNDVIYIGCDDGSLYALHRATGRLKWRCPTGDAIQGGALVVGEYVFVGNDDGDFLAVDAKTGKILWRFPTGDKIVGAANAVIQGDPPRLALLVGSYEGVLYCIDGATGEKLWEFEAENYINGSSAVQHGKAIFSGCDGMLRVIDTTTGTQDFAEELPTYVPTNPALADGVAYVVTYDGAAAAIDIQNRETLWTYLPPEESQSECSPAVGKSHMFFGNAEGQLIALNRQSGEVAWVFEAGDLIESAPLLAGDRVLFGSDDARLYMLDIDSGETVWTYRLGGAVVAAPAMLDGVIYIGDYSGTFYAFGAKP